MDWVKREREYGLGKVRKREYGSGVKAGVWMDWVNEREYGLGKARVWIG